MSPRILHITNGDSTSEGLKQTHIAGDISTYADVLHVGPVPPDDDIEKRQDVRNRWLDEAGIVSFDVAREFGRKWQAAFERHAEYDDVVMWFEHDLFDQLLLIRHLSWFARQGRSNGLELVQASDFLGPMHAPELVALYERRQPVNAQQFETAQRVWQTFTSSDHSALIDLRNTQSLPFLANAMTRMLQEYPDEKTGLGRTEMQILDLLTTGDYTFGGLFRANAEREEANFMGDSVFEWYLRELAHARQPLIELGDTISLTPAGRDVIEGRSNAIELNGIDRWIGGVHLT